MSEVELQALLASLQSIGRSPRAREPVRSSATTLLRFHPTLSEVHDRRAADDPCAARSAAQIGHRRGVAPIAERAQAAAGAVEGTLRAHERDSGRAH